MGYPVCESCFASGYLQIRENSCSKKNTCRRYDHNDTEGAWFAFFETGFAWTDPLVLAWVAAAIGLAGWFTLRRTLPPPETVATGSTAGAQSAENGSDG